MAIERIEAALKDIREGRMIILVDDEDRENEGDLVMSAELVTPEDINFMATHGKGLICLTLTEAGADKLGLHHMVPDNTSMYRTAFTVSIDSAIGITTGISAADRAKTILDAVADDAKPEDLVRPGHIFPLRARDGGVLVRTGQTEGSVDLSRLAGLKSAGIICEIMNEDGSMARMPDLEKFAKTFDLRIVSVADVIEYRLKKDRLVRRTAEAKVPTKHAGEFMAISYENDVDMHEHLALVKGDVTTDEPNNSAPDDSADGPLELRSYHCQKISDHGTSIRKAAITERWSPMTCAACRQPLVIATDTMYASPALRRLVARRLGIAE